jgi:hypothetical protein
MVAHVNKIFYTIHNLSHSKAQIIFFGFFWLLIVSQLNVEVASYVASDSCHKSRDFVWCRLGGELGHFLLRRQIQGTVPSQCNPACATIWSIRNVSQSSLQFLPTRLNSDLKPRATCFRFSFFLHELRLIGQHK